MQTHLAPIGLTHYCDTPLEVIIANVVLSRMNVHSTSFAHFQWSCWRQFMASAYVNGLLLMYVDARDLTMMIIVFV